ncbi:MAG: phosphate signaling complex protein PhoU [Pseudomonadales bacterium]
MNPHISEQYDAELDETRNLLMEMGGQVEKLLRDAIDALVTQDSALAEEVRRGDKKVNRLEVEIDEHCVNIIARRQPAASDLRTLISVMKASTDLERIGDEAGRIAKMAKVLADMEYPSDQYNDFRTLANMTHDLLTRSLDAFARLDADGALAVIAADETIDDTYDQILRNRSSAMRQDPGTVERAMSVIWAARSLERIGDHAKNLGEHVVYLVRGQDVRHSPKQSSVS